MEPEIIEEEIIEETPEEVVEEGIEEETPVEEVLVEEPAPVEEQWEITTRIKGKGERDASYDVVATKGEHRLEFSVSGIVSEEGLKQAVRGRIETYESVQRLGDGTLDISAPVVEPTAPDEAQLAKELWQKKRQALKEMISDMKDMQALGVVIAPEKLQVIAALSAWCDENVKEEYYL
jgi:hypothetical protein